MTTSPSALSIDPASVETPAARIEPRAAERQASLRKDYLNDIRRARILGILGALIWPFFVLYDYVQTRMVGTGNFAFLFLLRVLGEIVLLVPVIVLYRKKPISEMGFRRLVGLVMLGVSAMLAGMCVATDGLTSIYVAGNLLVGVAVVSAPQPFRSAITTITVSMSAHPIILTIATRYMPTMRAQLEQPDVVGRLVQFGLCAVFIGIALAGFSEFFFRMRTQIYESRGIGRYRLRRLLGSGGSGEVWAAYHIGLEREVALKLLISRIEHQTDAQVRFAREVRSTALLTHPNTVRLYDHGVTEDGVLFYAMELLDGVNLAELIAESGALPPARAVHLAQQAAHSLMEAHARGLVHRDVKPENLFVSCAGLETDFVKVLDFGIATGRAVDSLAGSDGDAVLGTPTTMSPEVIEGQRATDASDVYSMGVVMYFMVTGEYPFTCQTAATTLAAHVLTAPVPPSERLGAELPTGVEELIMRCLGKAPHDRPASGRVLAMELDTLASSLPWHAALLPEADMLLDSESRARARRRFDSSPVGT